MQLNETYRKALAGTLRSTSRGNEGILVITNDTSVHLDVFWVDEQGDHSGFNKRTKFWEAGYPGTRLAPGGGQLVVSSWPGNYWLARVSSSGAFAAVIEMADRNRQLSTISGGDLLDPNDIGGIPMPNPSIVVPPDGPRVLVGTGMLPIGNTVTREQFWQRQPESYSIAPGQKKTVSYTVISGMQDSSSDESSVTKSVSASASAGWGPISASVSAALSSSSTTTQQLTVSTQTTSFVSNEYDNEGNDHPEMVLVWQLVDVVTIFTPKGAVLSSIVSGTQPALVSGPFNVDDLPEPEPDQSVRADPAEDDPAGEQVRGGGGRKRPTLSSIEPAPADPQP
ncbi:hypothetical protein [Streptomyces sp. NRRL F-2580]|uniref:hypothetical protein n=1 Tax=Streptomyces sp. NRRL F-2580 TaxID=1463841 RepID=UPI00131E8378|nr:hypothetical protein [Streptomyces sp. NRRL F-2580]